MSEGVSVHAELCSHHHHVQHRVTVRVLGVWVGALVEQQVVHTLVTEEGRPGQRVLAHVGQPLHAGHVLHWRHVARVLAW